MMISIYSSAEGTDPIMPRSEAIGSLAVSVQEKEEEEKKKKKKKRNFSFNAICLGCKLDRCQNFK